MKNSIYKYVVLIMLIPSISTLAGPVAPLTTFTAGTTAKATEVNENFRVVKTAVDDNHVKITGLQSEKQKRVSGTCQVGSAITAIAEDGTVTCGKDNRFGTNTSLARNGRGSECTIGEVFLVAGGAGGATRAEGQLLAVSGNTALFSVLGFVYGGNGTTTFALPDLRNSAPNGLTYFICTEGIFPSPI